MINIFLFYMVFLLLMKRILSYLNFAIDAEKNKFVTFIILKIKMVSIKFHIKDT